MTLVRIGARQVGPGRPCFVIAEVGVNHDGSLDRALLLIEAAAEGGADAVKFQTFRAERIATVDAPKAPYQLAGTDPEESQLDMLRRLELTPDAHRTLKAAAESHGLEFLSSMFDEESADLLAGLGVSAFKIPSGEITNLALLAHVGLLGRPVILSTGMADLGEVETALGELEAAGNYRVVLLHCVSAYPAPVAEANLRAMATMEAAFGVPVGFSDHTLGSEVALAAVALGACMIEKHLTLDRSAPGPDHAASLEPPAFGELVRGIRAVESALGDGQKLPAPSERATAAVARKSLVAARDIAAGTVVTDEMVVLSRPGTGLPPGARDLIVGRVAAVDIARGTLLSAELVG
ncbi:MAG TPA: N-acetylneuraminate synthase [Gaiellaceae bacterium]|nr:N-acetylneuraminate synthase [Gaiellaceae bacterium]